MTRALAVLLLLAAPAHAGYVNTSDERGYLIETLTAGGVIVPSADQAKCDKLLRRYQRACPTPSPSPVPSPAPTKPQDCSDGRFVKAPNPAVLQWTGRAYEPGRKYHLCAAIPADAVAPGLALTLSSRNHSNTSCGDFNTWLVAPSGATYVTGGAQPGVGARFERGTWQLVVVLSKPCEPNKPLDYFLAWF